MSDEWKFYPCRFEDGTPVTVFFDQGVSESINSFSSPFLWLRIEFKSVHEYGFPADEENDILQAIEDDFDNFIASHAGLYVGRITYEGHRDFYSYAIISEKEIAAYADRLQREFDYEAQTKTEPDENKLRFWNDIYPSEHEWRWIWDSQIAQHLLEIGDPVETPRPVEHWAWFETEETATKFNGWAEKEGFTVKEITHDENELGNYLAQIGREDSPQSTTITNVTWAITSKCKELGGHYDGWECAVIQPDEEASS